MDCDELWFARNLIYSESGLLLPHPRAIRQFGTANCRFVNQDDVPLSNVDRQNIRSIQASKLVAAVRVDRLVATFRPP